MFEYKETNMNTKLNCVIHIISSILLIVSLVWLLLLLYDVPILYIKTSEYWYCTMIGTIQSTGSSNNTIGNNSNNIFVYGLSFVPIRNNQPWQKQKQLNPYRSSIILLHNYQTTTTTTTTISSLPTTFITSNHRRSTSALSSSSSASSPIETTSTIPIPIYNGPIFIPSNDDSVKNDNDDIDIDIQDESMNVVQISSSSIDSHMKCIIELTELGIDLAVGPSMIVPGQYGLYVRVSDNYINNNIDNYGIDNIDNYDIDNDNYDIDENYGIDNIGDGFDIDNIDENYDIDDENNDSDINNDSVTTTTNMIDTITLSECTLLCGYNKNGTFQYTINDDTNNDKVVPFIFYNSTTAVFFDQQLMAINDALIYAATKYSMNGSCGLAGHELYMNEHNNNNNNNTAINTNHNESSSSSSPLLTIHPMSDDAYPRYFCPYDTINTENDNDENNMITIQNFGQYSNDLAYDQNQPPRNEIEYNQQSKMNNCIQLIWRIEYDPITNLLIPSWPVSILLHDIIFHNHYEFMEIGTHYGYNYWKAKEEINFTK